MMLTAKAEEIDRIVAWNLGRMITSPNHSVHAKSSCAFKRFCGAARVKEGERLSAGAITIDPARHQVSVGGKRINLTSIEFKLLRTLVQRRGRVQERDRLLNEVWGYESVIDTRTVDTHVRRLREKLGKAGDVIETVRGFGYRLRED